MKIPRHPISKSMQKPSYSLRSPLSSIRALYDSFDAPICVIDCGQKCAPFNPSGMPFCCDICQAIPAAYHEEWEYLQKNTNLWHIWDKDDCKSIVEGENRETLTEMPENMLLLACLGPQNCQRSFRALSCRQFPFFPYVSSDYRFIGMACEWEFENTCWVINNLGTVSDIYRQQFIELYDRLFAFSQEVFENYQYHSERMRLRAERLRRRFAVLHRNGGYYLVSPSSERMARVNPVRLPHTGPC